MKKKLTFFVALFSCSLYAISQIGGNAIYNGGSDGSSMPDEVDLGLHTNEYSFSNILEASVMINVKASAWVAIFSLSQNGKTIEEAENLMQTRTELFKKMLGEEHLNPSRIFIDPVSLVPSYEMEVTEKKFSKTFNEVPSGFEMKKNIHITFTEHDQINRLIAVAAHAEIYDLVKVDYVVNDLDAILNQLRKEALKLLSTKKESMETAGMHLRFNRVGEMYGSVYPLERYAQYYAYKTGIAPSYTLRVNKGQPQQVQYNYAEKNKTIYYEKVSDKQFDKVINPVVGEPLVQIYLSVKGQYEVFDPENEALEKIHREKMTQLQEKDMELNIEAKKKDIELKGKILPPKKQQKPIK